MPPALRPVERRPEQLGRQLGPAHGGQDDKNITAQEPPTAGLPARARPKNHPAPPRKDGLKYPRPRPTVLPLVDKKPADSPSFEDSMHRLEAIVDAMES